MITAKYDRQIARSKWSENVRDLALVSQGRRRLAAKGLKMDTVIDER